MSMVLMGSLGPLTSKLAFSLCLMWDLGIKLRLAGVAASPLPTEHLFFNSRF